VKAGNGTVQSVPGGITCGNACSAAFDDGTEVLLTATAEAGWKLAGWGGGCTGQGGCSVTLRADTTVWATFAPATPSPPGRHVLTLARAGTGSGRVTSAPAGIDCGLACGAEFDTGTTVVLTAVADSGSTFAGWSGACSGPAGCSIAMSADASIVATFTAQPPPPDECAQLRYAEPGPAPRMTVEPLSKSTGVEYCRPGYVAGSGTLALPTEDTSGGMGTTLHFARPTGETLGKQGGPRIDPVTEQLDGFVVQNFAGGGAYWLSAYDSSGRELLEAQFGPSNLREDPTGGGVAVEFRSPSIVLNSYDAQLRRRFSLPLPPESGGSPLAVDRAGNTLVLSGSQRYGTGSSAAFWVDHEGAMGPIFMLLGPTDATPSLQATVRVGSGLFIASGGRWTLQLDSLSTNPEPAPAWLASRPVREMHMVHGGRGYAILPQNAALDATGDCVQSIEVVAPSGKSCGTSTFRAASGSCHTLGIRVGYDGTVVQQLPSSAEHRCPANDNLCTCTWQWWPGFFG
jgi:hypothetical protein